MGQLLQLVLLLCMVSGNAAAALSMRHLKRSSQELSFSKESLEASNDDKQDSTLLMSGAIRLSNGTEVQLFPSAEAIYRHMNGTRRLLGEFLRGKELSGSTYTLLSNDSLVHKCGLASINPTANAVLEPHASVPHLSLYSQFWISHLTFDMVAMPRYTTSQTYTDGNTQIVALAEGGEIEVYKGPGGETTRPRDDEDLEVKLRRISEQVPVRISNTSGSSAGSGSGDFHQYRQMRRREQDRLARMDADYLQRTAEQEFLKRQEERILAAEERTAKKRAKRHKKKEKKKLKKSRLGPGTDQQVQEGHEGPQTALQAGVGIQSKEGDEDSDGDEELENDVRIRESLGAPPRYPKTQPSAGGPV